MNALTTTQPMIAPESALTLKRFFERVRLNNAFQLDRATQPMLAIDMDAPAVHQEPFRRLAPGAVSQGGGQTRQRVEKEVRDHAMRQTLQA